MKMSINRIVAIIGGGVAGSEAAEQLASRGITAVLFEQNSLPYGKIEEGLPKWHIQLRNQEEHKIDEKLSREGVLFVPRTRFGSDITVRTLLDWGFHAILIAFGAWRDRRLPIADIDEYIGKGLCYQNAFVSWFNHKHERNYSGMNCQISDNAMIIGGGLASLDVAKIVMLETVAAVLRSRDVDCDLFTLEREGIPAFLKKEGLTFAKLGLQGCTIYYRKRLSDMPLVPLPEKLSDPRRIQIEQLRKRILLNFQQKYLFSVKECYTAVDKIVDGNRLVGMVFNKNEYANGSWDMKTGSSEKVYAPLVISAIGSVPQLYEDLPVRDDLLAIADHRTGRLEGFNNVFALGNAVTGRGNIRESLMHSRTTSRELIESYLQPDATMIENLVSVQEKNIREKIGEISQDLLSAPPLPTGTIQILMEKIQQLQIRAGYQGDYQDWIGKNRPVRLEEYLAENGSGRHD